MYKIETKTLEKALVITFDGFPTVEETEAFVKEYMANMSKIKANNHSLILDGADLKALKVEALPNLEQSYLAYMNEGFKKILVVTPKSITTKMQLERVAKKVNFPMEYIDSIDSALNIAKSL